ncbi:MAG: hypothetical protein PHH77_11585 [Victivallaceae bacterium]|nr:hypothetical protein [Victivallaceae bacterium]
MKGNGKIFIVFLLSCWFVSGIFAEVDNHGLKERYPDLKEEHGMNLYGIYWRDAKPNEYVYLVPAHFGATVFILLGNVVGTPVKAIYNVCTLNFKGDDYLPPVEFSNCYLAQAGGYLLGTPFWILEKTFYEAPIWAYDSMFGDDEYKFADD